MLNNAHVSKVYYDQRKQCCTIYMQNGDVLCGEDLADRQQLEAYIKMLREEDGLIFPAPKDWKYQTTENITDNIADNEKPLLRVQCFGNFEVFYNEVPLHFERKGAKEIFAFLIDKRGASVNRSEICNAIWENDILIERRKAYFRTLILSLRNTLKSCGLENIFITHRDDYAINTMLIDCDYYRYLSGDTDMSVRFRGEYMSQYSWAENTLGQLIEESDARY